MRWRIRSNAYSIERANDDNACNATKGDADEDASRKETMQAASPRKAQTQREKKKSRNSKPTQKAKPMHAITKKSQNTSQQIHRIAVFCLAQTRQEFTLAVNLLSAESTNPQRRSRFFRPSTLVSYARRSFL
jgi:hypothetical protein